jgi:hypothetical protein
MRRRPLLLALAVLLLSVRGAAAAPPYPTYGCVATKLKATAIDCQHALKAWSAWDKKQDDTKRDAALTEALRKLEAAFADADAESAAAGVDCSDTTLSGSAMGAMIDAAVLGTVNEVNTGLDLGTKDDGGCGAQLLNAAAVKCKKLLKAESAYLKSLGKTPKPDKRDAAIDKARTKFSRSFASATSGGCPTAVTVDGLEGRIDDLSDNVVTNATVSPHVSAGTWQKVTPATEVDYLGQALHPICAKDTPYVFFARRGSVNKLLVYFQGGGACWDFVTCSAGACSQTADDSDNPNLVTSGFADASNPANPFRDWNAVFITYCTCDVHWGDATYTHTSGTSSITINHRGFENAQVVEKFAREHFVAPDEVFVTGSSAGAYGAIAGSLYLQERVYKAARFNVLGDAGNGVITHDFLVDNLTKWGVDKGLPKWIPALNKPFVDLSNDQLWSAAANFYPHAKFAQYASAYDGGNGSQTQFYNIMLHPGDLPTGLMWWLASCDWNQRMRDLAQMTVADTVATDNYRYYVGSGSRHTIWGSDKVYSDTTGGVLPMVDWLAQMRSDDPAWTNQQCAPCNLMPGACSATATNAGDPCQDDVDCPGGSCGGEDPRPSPLVPPFGPGGVVTCP